MTYQDPTPPEEPSSRLAGRMPWILLGIGGLAILAVIGAILAMRRGGDQVNVSVAAQSTSTPAVVGVPVTVVITATSVPPTQGFPTLIVPTQTPQAEVIVTPVPKAPPATAAVVAPPPGAPPVGASGETGAQTKPTSVPAPTLVQPTIASAPPTTAPPRAPPTAWLHQRRSHSVARCLHQEDWLTRAQALTALTGHLLARRHRVLWCINVSLANTRCCSALTQRAPSCLRLEQQQMRP